jgi:hypothetical protein
MSKSEEAALLGRLDKAAAELDAREGVPLECLREKTPGWAENNLKVAKTGAQPCILLRRAGHFVSFRDVGF